MKKIIIGVSIVLLAFGATACHKERKVRSAGAGSAEVLSQIEVQAQSNDAAAADPNTALTCTYVLVQGTSVSKAEVKTAGKCDFASLRNQVAAAGNISDAAAAQIISAIAADASLPGSVKSKWDCKAYNVRSNVRSVGAQDCKDGKGVSDATAKAISAALGL